MSRDRSKYPNLPALNLLLAGFLFLGVLQARGEDDGTPQASPPRLSFEGLENSAAKQVSILGTFFRAGEADYINFIPVEPKTKGVWTRRLSPEAREQALARMEPQQQVPGIAFCDVTSTRTKAPKRPPGVTTGTYYGPIHSVMVTQITFLSKEEATEMATTLIQDAALRSRFIKRFQ